MLVSAIAGAQPGRETVIDADADPLRIESLKLYPSAIDVTKPDMKHCCAVLPILFLALGLSAQPDRNQKFAAAGYLGFNFSQIHGDSYFGYNNAGLRFGLETQYLLQPAYFISLGIGYSREGVRPSRKEIDAKGGERNGA